MATRLLVSPSTGLLKTASEEAVGELPVEGEEAAGELPPEGEEVLEESADVDGDGDVPIHWSGHAGSLAVHCTHPSFK